MQNQENCYKNVWILSGTSDGPVIANRLLELNYSVFASVLTYKAGQAYIENPKLHIITGKLNNKEEVINIQNDLKNSGVKVGPLHEHRDGTASFYMKDTEGNWLEMLYVPPGGIQSNV